MNALDYANGRTNVVVRWAGVGAPAGTETFFSPPDTELPFDLAKIDGRVREDGSFEAVDLPELVDTHGNTIYAVWLRADTEAYSRLYADWEAGV